MAILNFENQWMKLVRLQNFNPSLITLKQNHRPGDFSDHAKLFHH